FPFSGNLSADPLLSSIDAPLPTQIRSGPRMEIICPTCQKKLQIADAHAGQIVKCPSCAANFQAPALPSMGTLPTPEPLVPPPPESPGPAATFTLAPDLAAPPPVIPQIVVAPPEPMAKPKPKGDYTHSFAINLRQEIVTLIPPLGLLVLFFLSFFPWSRAE